MITNSSSLPAPEQTMSKSMERPLDGMKILLVDDLPDPRRRLLQLLGVAGADVTLECHALAAAHTLSAAPHRFDAVIIECHCSRHDGEQAGREVRSAGYERPLFAVIQIRDEETERALKRAGFDAVVQGPFEAGELIGAVAARVRQEG